MHIKPWHIVNVGQYRFVMFIIMKLTKAHGKPANSGKGHGGKSKPPSCQELLKAHSGHSYKTGFLFDYWNFFKKSIMLEGQRINNLLVIGFSCL